MYVGMNVNGKQLYLSYKKNGTINLVNDKNKVTIYPTEERAYSAINNLSKAYKAMRQYFVIVDEIDDEDVIDAGMSSIGNELTARLSSVDQEISDLEHYMEFKNLDACKGYKAYRMMHDARVKRRKIKNQLYMIGSAKQAMQKCAEGLQDQKYEARKIPGLFDGKAKHYG